MSAGSLYELVANDIKGNPMQFDQFKDKVVLFVNVATNWGKTKRNYEELNEVYDKYHEQGLEIVAFPCNQFLNQEPGTNEEIETFARGKGAKYHLMEKIMVNGPETHEVYRYLKANTDQEQIDWNFAKVCMLIVMNCILTFEIVSLW